MGNPPKIIKAATGIIYRDGGHTFESIAHKANGPVDAITRLTTCLGEYSFTKKEALAFLKDTTGLSGKPIEKFEEKILAATNDPRIRNFSIGFENFGDTVRFLAEHPTIDMLRANPKLFLFRSETSLAKGGAKSVTERLSECRNLNELRELVIDANTAEDCEFIIKKLENTNAKDVVEAAKIKADYLNRESKVGEACKAYIMPQIRK